MRTLRCFAFSLVALAPLGALADGAGEIATPHVSAAPAPRSAERGPCVGGGELGSVASLSGDVRALASGGAERTLACDDVVSACDIIVTGSGGSASLLISDAIVQLGPNTRAEISARPAPEVALESGAVRVVDTRAQASDRVQLYTPVLAASTGHGDAELVRDAESVRACALSEPLVVTSRDGAQTIPAGTCVSTGTQVLGGLAPGRAGEPSVALGDVASCPFHVAGLPALLPPVASPAEGGPELSPFDPPGRDSCDDPGSGCAAEPICEICEDPDPGTGCGFPGSDCGAE